MQIKYTIEILTKDIQDIEKLVGKLQNSRDGSAIELDLALSKLRNVYEILTMIKADRLHELIHPKSEPVKAPTPAPIPEPPKEIVPEPPKASVPEPAPEHRADTDTGILAEKFSAESSINENLAGQRGKGVDAKLAGQPIENIGRNIGINDRFLIIRELFNGDSDGFGRMINNLDGADNYQAALGLLNDQFAGSMEHEGVEILSGLVKRRFIKE